MKFSLTKEQKNTLRRNKVKLTSLAVYNPIKLAELLNITKEEAEKIIGSAQFQSINSIGPKFAADLIEMGYYSLDSLRDKEGSDLLDEHESIKGYQTDPCVEDQFRRVVHYANTMNNELVWSDFTLERKSFREKYGYPDSRPRIHWTEVYYK